MANLTKILLGLNIAAGAAGLFFGLSIIPGKVGTLSEQVKSEKDKATTAVGKATKLESEKAQLVTDLSTKNTEAQDYKNKWQALSGSSDQQTRDMAKLQTENQALLGEKSSWNTERGNMQAKVDEGTVAMANLSTAQQEIATLQAKLKKLTDPPKKQNPKTKTNKGGFVGKITNIEPRFGYVTINVGSSQGYKVKDRFKVYHNNTLVGGVEIYQLGPSGLDAITRPYQAIDIPSNGKLQRNDDLVEVK